MVALTERGSLMGLTKKPTLDAFGRHCTRLPAVRLYIDDLDRIETLLRARCEDVQISAGNYVADSASDLTHADRKALKSVTFQTKNPNLTVNLGDKIVASDGDSARLVAVDVLEIVNARKRLLPPIALFGWWLGGYSLFLVLYGIGSLFTPDVSLWWFALTFGFPLLVLLGFIVNMRGDNYDIRVSPLPKNEHQITSSRHRVTWISSAVFFVFGAVVGHFWR